MTDANDPIPQITRDDEAAGSGDLAAGNVARLKALFPEIVTDGKVDFDVLRQLLGDAVENGEERYGLSWKGKHKARAFALTPSLGTLRPAPADSVDWDTTQNILVEGDNLEALKLLRRSYAGRIKLIYIDPPYNTGKDFVYSDDYRDPINNYLILTGQKSDAGILLSSDTETTGRRHGRWLNLIYPRLELAKELLAPDGVICVSHDDHERGNLAQVMEQVFGTGSELACLIWDKQHSQQQGVFKRYHEYIAVHAAPESIGAIRGGEGLIEAGALKKISRANPASDFEFPAGVRFDAPDGFELTGTYGDSEQVTVRKGRLIAQGGKTIEPVTLSAGWTQKNQMQSWFSGRETFDTREQRVVEFFLSSTGKLKSIKERGRITPSSLLPKYGMVSEQTAALEKLMGASVFSNPKPIEMVANLVEWFTSENDIVCDFFAGSGTSGHAVMKVSASSGEPRRFILVQLPETLDENEPEQASAARFLGSMFKPLNIAELTKERLRRARKQVRDADPNAKVDTGFRVYKLATSNLKPWQPDAENMEASILDSVDNVLPGRTEDDLLVELLLKTGIDLTLPQETSSIAGRTVHALGGGTLMVCLGNIGADDAEALGQGMADWVVELDPVQTTIYFKDTGLGADGNRSATKANLAAILRQRLGDRIAKIASM